MILRLLICSLVSRLLIADPSISPIFDDYGYAHERCRIMADIDGDGDLDMLLSYPLKLFGNAGGLFRLFERTDSGFRDIGEVFAYPDALSVEVCCEGSRLWTYVRGSGSEGLFGYYPVANSSVGKFVSLTIYPGDGGTEFGRKLYQAAFAQDLRVEYSKTVDGQVTWSHR